MPLQTGTRLGPYEIIALIGAGGMGEVYAARDTRLERKVAVKVLTPELAGDTEFRARFAHEAKAISALNHPHICGLYDIGREHDTEYLVLELLEGETLAARIERGPLPLAQVLRFGIEIADALETAHRHGIVHRDLKPGNIMLTASGTKLLDFGLAKQTVGAAGQALSMLATAPGTGTAQGTIITASAWSRRHGSFPEQNRHSVAASGVSAYLGRRTSDLAGRAHGRVRGSDRGKSRSVRTPFGRLRHQGVARYGAGHGAVLVSGRAHDWVLRRGSNPAYRCQWRGSGDAGRVPRGV